MVDESKPKRISLNPECIARGCVKSKKSEPNVSFFPMPHDGEKRRKWLHTVGRDDLINNKSISYEIILLCSDHFEPHMINCFKTLRPNAEPIMKIPLFDEVDPNSLSIVKTEDGPTQTELIRPKTEPIMNIPVLGEEAPNSLPTVKVVDKSTQTEMLRPNAEPIMNIPVFDEADSNSLNLVKVMDGSTQTKVLRPNAEPINIPVFDEVDPNSLTIVKEENGSTQTDEIISDTSVYPKSQLSSSSTKCRIKFEPDDEMDINSKKTQTDNADDVSTGSGVITLHLDKIHDYELKIESLESELKQIKNNNLTKKIWNDEFTETMKEIIHWKNQMQAKYKDKHYTIEFILFALNLYVSSRHIYKSLISALNLPSAKSLKQIKLNVPSTLNDQSLNCLANKLNSLPDKAKYCSLIIDTIDLKPHLYYNIIGDEIIGLHNLNGLVTNIVASTVYFIMLRGIAFEWQQPVAYLFLANNLCFAELNYWLNDIIVKLSNLGIEIMALISSPEEHFIRYAEFKSVSEEKPFFTANGQKIYYLFDAPRLLTSLRNDLVDNDFYYKNQKISWSHIEALYAYKKQNLLNVLPKITDAHVSPSISERNEVKYAAQIFSQSVFSVFDILMSINFVPKEARPTAQFIKTINDLFDVLNSNKLKCDNEYQSAFTLSENQVETLLNVQKMFKSLLAVSKATKDDVTKKISTFKSIEITTHSLILLSGSLKEHGIRHILTRRLSREPADSFKKILNLKDGIGSKVTAIQFRRMFAKQFIKQMLPKTQHDKFHGDISELLMKTKVNLICGKTEIICCPRPKNNPLVSERPVPLYGDYDYRFKLPKRQAFTYVASYLLFKCAKKHQCPVLKNMLAQCPTLELDENINPTSSFSGQLKIPSVPFCNNIRVLDKMFIKKFSKAVISKPAKNMMYVLSQVFFPPCGCFPTQYLLALFIRFKMYSILIHNNRIKALAACQQLEVKALKD